MTSYNRTTILAGVGVAVVVGGILSYFASASPDGLEKFQLDVGAAQPAHDGVQAPPVAFEECKLKWLGDGFWANAAGGIIGSLGVMAILLGVGWVIRRRRARAGL